MSRNSTSSTPILLDANKAEDPSLPPPLDGLRRHGEFWIEDGNLILVAKDAAFRVYRGLLAEQSMVLAEMAATASEDFFEIFDGCPIVRLSESPQDLVHLLRLLLPKSRRRLHPKDEKEHTCDELSALVRLSHKYRIRDVEEQALELLRDRYTDDFDKWRFGVGKFVARPAASTKGDCIGVVNVARLTDTPSLLPTALYSCCLLGGPLLDGWTREDGCVEYLSTDDLKRCLIAQERLCKEAASIMCEVLEIRPSTRCSDSVGCCAALKEIALSIMRGSLARGVGCAALASSGWMNVIHTKVLFCDIRSQCKHEILLRDMRARRELWGKLPEIFGSLSRDGSNRYRLSRRLSLAKRSASRHLAPHNLKCSVVEQASSAGSLEVRTPR